MTHYRSRVTKRGTLRVTRPKSPVTPPKITRHTPEITSHTSQNYPSHPKNYRSHACAQTKSEAAATTGRKTTSHGIKKHGKSVAASDDSGSAIPTFWSAGQQNARASRQNRGGKFISGSLCKLYRVLLFFSFVLLCASFATASFRSALQFTCVSQSAGGSNINMNRRCCMR